MGSEQYNFPDLTVADIISCLKDLVNIQLDEQAFKTPDPQQWQEVFLRILCEATDTPVDSHIQQSMLTTDLEYAELYNDAIPQVLSVNAMQRVLEFVGVQDFSIADILTPTPYRLRKICSAFVNYMRFKTTRYAAYDAWKLDIEQHREQHDTLMKRNEELKQRLSALRAAQAQQEPEVEQAQEQIQQVSLRMQEQHQHKTNLQKQILETKTKITEKIASRDQVCVALLQVKEAGDKLSQKIVQSPERVREEQESMERFLPSLKEELNRKIQRVTDLQQQRENCRQMTLDSDKGLQHLEAVQASINKENEIAAKIAQIMDLCQDQSQQLRDFNNRKGQLQHVLSTRQEKLAKLSLQHHNRMKVLREQSEALKEENVELMQKESSNMSRKCEVLELRKKREEEVKQLDKIVEQKISDTKDLYSELLLRTDKFHQGIGTMWEDIKQLLSE